MSLDRDDYDTVDQIGEDAEAVLGFANQAIALLDAMDAFAGHRVGPALLDDNIAGLRATLHDDLSTTCEILGEIAENAGLMVGYDLRAAGRRLSIDWNAQYEAAVRKRLLAAE